MKVKVIRTFVDKNTMELISKDTEIEVTEERFSELTTGPRGVFVEEIKGPPVDPPDVKFNKMTKAELVEYAKSIEIELNMEMTKDEMIEILQQK